MAQTAVDFLFEQIANGNIITEKTDCGYLITMNSNYLEQAKQMEKDQIIEAFTKGELVPDNYYNDPIPFNINGKNYYYATYGKKEML